MNTEYIERIRRMRKRMVTKAEGDVERGVYMKPIWRPRAENQLIVRQKR